MTPKEANDFLDIVMKSSQFQGLEHIRDSALRALREGMLYSVSKGSIEEDEPDAQSTKKRNK
jgi:hypothetical protein